MCGIFGALVGAGATVSYKTVTTTLAALYRLSESRGKESAGLHVRRPRDGRAWTLKGACRATDLMRAPAYADILQMAMRPAFADAGAAEPIALIAHSRLVTNGTAALPANNQPVRWGPVTVVHNGIVVNDDALWAANPHLRRNAEVDTEVLAALLADRCAEGADPAAATADVFRRLRGAASIAWVDDARPVVTLATNTGDLHAVVDRIGGWVVFASERHILTEALAPLGNDVDVAVIDWVAPGTGRTIDLETLAVANFAVAADTPGQPSLKRLLPDRSTIHVDLTVGHAPAAPSPGLNGRAPDLGLLRYGEARVAALRRCTRCILPETFPFIHFDAAGVCNYCRNHRPRYAHLDRAAAKRTFIETVSRYRSADGSPDVIVAFSGGRDSSYGLHLIKTEFGLNPVTFTYDWGMVTDLARRNIARICGQLGIQNILVSADIAAKRDNIRKNVAAWLRQPDLGMVPLFMAGDKHFFRVVNILKGQTGIRLDLWCANPLENTDFKSGFCGVPPDFGKARVDHLSVGRRVRMAAHYGGQFLRNPAYLNASLLDTAGSFLAYYVEPRRDFFFVFDHMVWDEAEVNNTIRDEYDWEIAADTDSTWRIGDGTAPFYNYIYMTARGFTEFDTFRSNQIREGLMSRDDALASVLRENRPRGPSIHWYLETIGLDFDETIRRINRLDTLCLHA
jgi:glucosamine--fructose-6-phosphate aminotransferase (isomerizing)